MRSWANSLFALALGTSAAATPPEIVTVEDRLFARTENRVYLLREFNSNDGLHFVWRSDILLVTRTLGVGDDRGYRGVARLVDLGPWNEDGPRTRPVPLSSPANPFDLFAEGAWPLHPPRAPFPEQAILLPNGLHATARTMQGETFYHLPMTELEDRIEDTLASSRAILPFERIGGGSIGPDPFNPALYDPAADCRVTATLPLIDYDTDPMLVRLDCLHEDDGLQSARLWIVVPQRDD